MIYVNGDSWTSGWPDEETYGHREFSWPHLLSLKLKQPVFNDARAASSNYRIYRRTFDYLLEHKPKLAIICLTSWTRLEYGNSVSGKIYQYMPTRDPKFYKTDWHPYLAYTNFLRQIISLQNISIQTNTQLWLLDTFENNLNRSPTIEWFRDILKEGDVFDQMDDDRIDQKFSKILNLSTHINYDNFIDEKSYQELIKGCKLEKKHPVKDGHTLISNIVYNKITNY